LPLLKFQPSYFETHRPIIRGCTVASNNYWTLLSSPIWGNVGGS